MRLNMDEVRKQHESTKKLYEQGLTVAPVDVKRVLVKRVLDLFDTIEALQAENEQLQAQVARVKEVLRKAREVLYNLRMDDYPGFSAICDALAAIDKAIGGKAWNKRESEAEHDD